MKPVGLLGGTFDPIHNGHLRIGLEAYEALSLEEVRIIPVNLLGHRAKPKASVHERCDMISSVVKPPFCLDEIEVNRGGISYTIDTLESLSVSMTNCSLCLLIGEDAFDSLVSWHRADELLLLAHLVVISRGSTISDRKGEWSDFRYGKVTTDSADLCSSAGFIYFLQVPFFPISSTDIRRKIKNGLSINGLVPDSVKTIIREKKLYKYD